MDYNQFKDFVKAFLWKQNDADFSANLDYIIQMAESELSVDLEVQENQVSTIAYAGSDAVRLPGDYFSMRSIVIPSVGELKYVSPADLLTIRYSHPNTVSLVYSIQDDVIMLAGPFAKANEDRQPFALIITYLSRVPNFKETDRSWVADKYLSIYLYCVAKNSVPFLQEDERTQSFTSQYNSAVTLLRDREAMSKARGVATSMPLPYAASVNRRGSRR